MVSLCDRKNSPATSCQGGCQCGNIRFECGKSPTGLYICHCLECRRQSSSAFGISYIVPRNTFHLHSGIPQFWVRNTDSGRILECAFCPNCGSRLWHPYSNTSETVSIKGGTLDIGVDITNAIHIWTSRKLLGVIIPEHAKQFLEEPESKLPIEHIQIVNKL